jgi:hypothetical protein
MPGMGHTATAYGLLQGSEQYDAYGNRDIGPLEQALVIVEHLVDHGRSPADISWHVDGNYPASPYSEHWSKHPSLH